MKDERKNTLRLPLRLVRVSRRQASALPAGLPTPPRSLALPARPWAVGAPPVDTALPHGSAQVSATLSTPWKTSTSISPHPRATITGLPFILSSLLERKLCEDRRWPVSSTVAAPALRTMPGVQSCRTLWLKGFAPAEHNMSGDVPIVQRAERTKEQDAPRFPLSARIHYRDWQKIINKEIPWWAAFPEATEFTTIWKSQIFRISIKLSTLLTTFKKKIQMSEKTAFLKLFSNNWKKERKKKKQPWRELHETDKSGLYLIFQ